MQIEEAKALREKWRQKGEGPCEHPAIETEYYRGTHTLDYVCISCGEEFSLAQKNAIEQKRI